MLALTLPAAAGSPGAEPEIPTDPSTAIVKIYVAAVMPDAFAPWRPGSSSHKTGSGAVIEGHRILTNAHVVEGHTFVQVRLHGHPEKHAARVTFVSHEADLALLAWPLRPRSPATPSAVPWPCRWCALRATSRSPETRTSGSGVPRADRTRGRASGDGG